VLYFGIIRPYKGVDSLLDAFADVKDSGMSLRFVGSAKGDRGDTILAAQRSDSRISSVLEYVTDAHLVEEIQRAELTVFPYREMHNSGSVLLALSVGRPVLVPMTPANQALADEVGPGWVYQYEGTLSSTDLEECLAAVRASERGLPDLSLRDWRVVGHQLSDAYRRALKKGAA
jgi:beta-1,4-mannosyltransferase